jgi:hypothetical protein
MLKKDNTKSWKFKLKIALIFLFSLIGLVIVSMIPRWLDPWKSSDESNSIIRNTFYSVTPRATEVNLNVIFDDILIHDGTPVDVIYGIGVDLLLERLEDNYNLILEFNSILYFVHATETPTSNVTGFIMFYTDTLLIPGFEVYGIDAQDVNFNTINTLGLQIVKV